MCFSVSSCAPSLTLPDVYLLSAEPTPTSSPSFFSRSPVVRLVFSVKLYITLQLLHRPKMPAINTGCITALWAEVFSVAAVMKPDEAQLIKSALTCHLVGNICHCSNWASCCFWEVVIVKRRGFADLCIYLSILFSWVDIRKTMTAIFFLKLCCINK